MLWTERALGASLRALGEKMGRKDPVCVCVYVCTCVCGVKWLAFVEGLCMGEGGR